MGRVGVAEIIVISSSCFNFFLEVKKFQELMKGIGKQVKEFKICGINQRAGVMCWVGVSVRLGVGSESIIQELFRIFFMPSC
jgi:hypothetical protein